LSHPGSGRYPKYCRLCGGESESEHGGEERTNKNHSDCIESLGDRLQDLVKDINEVNEKQEQILAEMQGLRTNIEDIQSEISKLEPPDMYNQRGIY
jgi:chromosome segregation ATPase